MTSFKDPSLSVVVCTWNPGLRIDETLVSLRHQSLSHNSYEVLIVDNASNDGISTQYLQNKCKQLDFKYVHEPELGLSAARNTGIYAAKGNLIYFIDDDAVAPAHLLEKLIDIFSEKSDAMVVGGPVHGLWENLPPVWLSARYWRMLSLLTYGPEPRPLIYPEILIGCNVAFRKEAFAQSGFFDIRLGRKGASLAGNEERLLQKRLMEQGALVYYDPNIYVFHKVPSARLTLDYFKKRTEDGSESNLYTNDATPKGVIKSMLKGFYLFILGTFYHGLKHQVKLTFFRWHLYAASITGHIRYIKRYLHKP